MEHSPVSKIPPGPSNPIYTGNTAERSGYRDHQAALDYQPDSRKIYAWFGTGRQSLARSGDVPDPQNIMPLVFDLLDETSIAAAVARWKDSSPDLVEVASGVLTLPDGTGPERSRRHIAPDAMTQMLELNTVGPALVAKHVLPLFPREQGCAEYADSQFRYRDGPNAQTFAHCWSASSLPGLSPADRDVAGWKR